ncbi:PREDICTED: prefoldin subunit 1 isoform X2 [Sturnus vulgaris]|uniref:prefoldin subunit 1 isoform X2 n=1 Tax=Sturnus vulgaris TaxID=9172 RepID=UPI00071A5C56|nr:PREDICTED: prefoldin subunit 1 isoform X2 [Sturnus vulgaris]
MAAPVDLELKKAFSELQAKVMDTQQKVKLADLQIEQLTKTKKHAHLTDTEVMMLVDETRMYEGVGRMFILQPKGVIHNQLLEKQRIAEEKIKELEKLSLSPSHTSMGHVLLCRSHWIFPVLILSNSCCVSRYKGYVLNLF